MSRRRRGALLSALGVAMLAVGFLGTPAQADAPDRVAWWFQLNGNGLPVGVALPTPVVPDGGLYVQQGPQGPMAYGAVHITVGQSLGATLVLTSASGPTPAVSKIQACPTASTWQKPQSEPGTWDTRPQYTTPCTPGRISSDNMSVGFAFDPQIIRNGAVDVAIVPSDGATPFAVAFAAPDSKSVKVDQPSAPLYGSAPTTAPTSAAPTSVPTAAKPNATRAAEPAAPTTTAPQAVQQPTAPAQLATDILSPVGLGDPDRGARALSLLGAAALIVGWWLMTTRSGRTPQLLGALAGGGAAPVGGTETPRSGGIGRFSRPRAGSPRRLR